MSPVNFELETRFVMLTATGACCFAGRPPVLVRALDLSRLPCVMMPLLRDCLKFTMMLYRYTYKLIRVLQCFPIRNKTNVIFSNQLYIKMNQFAIILYIITHTYMLKLRPFFQNAGVQSQVAWSGAVDTDGASTDLAHESSVESAMKIKKQGWCQNLQSLTVWGPTCYLLTA